MQEPIDIRDTLGESFQVTSSLPREPPTHVNCLAHNLVPSLWLIGSEMGS